MVNTRKVFFIYKRLKMHWNAIKPKLITYKKHPHSCVVYSVHYCTERCTQLEANLPPCHTRRLMAGQAGRRAKYLTNC